MGRVRTPIYVEIDIAASLDRVWALTQDTALHPRWDLRFSSISPVDDLEDGGYRFRYELRMPLHTIVGMGTSIGERRRPDGTRTSALRFTTDDVLSPLGDGRGYWRYLPTETGVRFITGYDYEPGWGVLGRFIDPFVTRPFIGWMTAWSFDRLRIWAETGVEPERWSVLSVVRFWRHDRPRASHCRRRPRLGNVMAGAPRTLDRLEAP